MKNGLGPLKFVKPALTAHTRSKTILEKETVVNRKDIKLMKEDDPME